MGKQYEHLSLEDWCWIARLHEDGQSVRQIAAALDRPPSTISRELRRNRGKQVGYRPSYAHEQAKARRWTGSRLERDGELRRLVLDRLRHGWSPEQIAGRLACDKAATSISHESIYRFIYAQIRRTNDGSWRHYLPRAKAKRGWRGRKGGSPASFIQGRVSIAERPEAATTAPSQDIGKPTSCSSKPMARHPGRPRARVPYPHPRQTAKQSRRTHRSPTHRLAPASATRAAPDHHLRQRHRVRQALPLQSRPRYQTFFCDTHSPWQKGGIENAIGRMRRPCRARLISSPSAQNPQCLRRRYNNTHENAWTSKPQRGIRG